MSEATLNSAPDRGSVRALSALAGLAPLTVSGVVNAAFALVDRTFGITSSLGFEARMEFVNAQQLMAFVGVVFAALATGWILYRSGSVRWGVIALGIVGLVDAWGRLLNLINVMAPTGGYFSGLQVTSTVFSYGAPVLLLAGMVLLGAWLRRLKGAR